MQCPQCKNNVPVTEAQFGALYTCPQCVAVYFVGFDGQPEYGSMEIPLEETVNDVFVSSTGDSNSYQSVSGLEHSHETLETFSQPVFESSQETSSQDISLNNDFNPQTYSENETAQHIEPARPLSSTFAAAAQEITDYGNQEEIISSISYDVFIKGLDTKEMMLAFKEAIEDSKFAWLAQDIIQQIKNGEVVLKNLNPIKAFVLASRIQFLDLDIEWKQNVAF